MMKKGNFREHWRSFGVLEKMNTVVSFFALVAFAVIAVCWGCGSLGDLSTRYLLLVLVGLVMTMNGLTGYRQSRWAGVFMTGVGALLLLSNGYMLIRL